MMRLAALGDGAVDLLSRNITVTLSRDSRAGTESTGCCSTTARAS